MSLSVCLSLQYHKHIIAIIAVTTKEHHPPAHRTVHQLRPVDIDIIASLGDSITAGTGAKARNIFEVSFPDPLAFSSDAENLSRHLCPLQEHS